MLDPHKAKYHALYWEMAYAAARQSVATRHQVGALVVTPTGMLSPGWNGMPPGMDNVCEYPPQYIPEEGVIRGKTRPEVMHAEHNAIDKMQRQRIDLEGSILFVTLSPCHRVSGAFVYYCRRASRRSTTTAYMTRPMA